MTVGDLVEVRLLRFPVVEAAKAAEHFDGLKREFALLAMQGTKDDLPQRLLDLVAALTVQYESTTAEPDRLRREALARGDREIPVLVYRTPPGSDEAAISVARMLDEADDFCRKTDLLLTMATPPRSLAYRRWYFGEFIAQLHGLPPLAWPDADHDALAASPVLRGT